MAEKLVHEPIDNELGVETDIASTQDLLAKEKRQLQKIKDDAPDLYIAAEEEFDELELKFKALEWEISSNNPDLKEMKREFSLDLRGLKNIWKLKWVDNSSLQDFVLLLSSDEVNEEVEETVYDLLKKKSTINSYIKSWWILPTDSSNVWEFIEGVENIANEKKSFSKFSRNIKLIKDFSNLSDNEFRGILESAQKYEALKFNMRGIWKQLVEIKTETVLRKDEKKAKVIDEHFENDDVSEKEAAKTMKEERSTKAEERSTKAEERSTKAEERSTKTETVQENYSERILLAEKKMWVLLWIKSTLSWYEELSYLDTTLDWVTKIWKLEWEEAEDYHNRLNQEINKVENFFKKPENLKPLFNKIKKIDSENRSKWIKGSLYKEVYKELWNISPWIKQSLKAFVPEPWFEWKKHREDSTQEEAELSWIIAWNPDTIWDAIKLSEGKYLLWDKEFDFSDGEAKVSTVSDTGYKIELWKISKSDLQVLNRINWKIDESSRRLGNLEDELWGLEQELRQLIDSKPLSWQMWIGWRKERSEKIEWLKQRIEAKQKRIEKMQQTISDLMLDKKAEEKDLSKFITKDKQEKVNKAMNIVNKTGLSLLPQSFTDELIARINLSPTLRASLWFKREIDLSEWILGFWTELWDIGKMIKFWEVVNWMISWDKNRPISINALKAWNSWHWQNQAEVLMLINKNLTTAGWYDVNKALSNIAKSQKENDEE